MKQLGFLPDNELVLHDMGGGKKEYVLCGHSEKLAVGFGLIVIGPGTPIEVRKNLLVCPDCHSSFKYISRITCREIELRDTSRHHHFQEGMCSCADIW